VAIKNRKGCGVSPSLGQPPERGDSLSKGAAGWRLPHKTYLRGGMAMFGKSGEKMGVSKTLLLVVLMAVLLISAVSIV